MRREEEEPIGESVMGLRWGRMGREASQIIVRGWGGESRAGRKRAGARVWQCLPHARRRKGRLGAASPFSEWVISGA